MNIVIKKIMMFFCVMAIMFIFITPGYAEEKPKNSLECLQDKDCSEEMQQINDKLSDTQEEPITQSEEPNSLGFNLVKMVVTLFIIIGLIYLLLKFLKKRSKLFNNMQAMENLGGLSVGQNKSIQIVRIGSKFYIIGVGDNVEMLQEITDEDLIEDLIHKQNQEEQTDGRFASFLKSKLNTKQDHDNEHGNFATLFSNELENLKQNRKTVKQQRDQKEDRYE